jgi:hypothetical protein
MTKVELSLNFVSGSSPEPKMFYADTRNVVENGVLVDRFCDDSNQQMGTLASSKSAPVAEYETFLEIAYAKPPDEPIHWRVPASKINSTRYGYFVCDPY